MKDTESSGQTWMTERQYRKWREERAKRAPVVIEKATALMQQENPDPIAIWAMDGCLRTVLYDIHWFWMTWNYFREEVHSIGPNYFVIEGWEPE